MVAVDVAPDEVLNLDEVLRGRPVPKLAEITTVAKVTQLTGTGNHGVVRVFPPVEGSKIREFLDTLLNYGKSVNN